MPPDSGGPDSRPLGGLADAVGMRASASQIAAIHNQIFLADWPIFKPAF